MILDHLQADVAVINHCSAGDMTSTVFKTNDLTTQTLTGTTAVLDHVISDDMTITDGTDSLVVSPTTMISTEGFSFQTEGPGKSVQIVLNGSNRMVINDTRTTVYGDLYVTGTIFNVPNYSNFTPFLMAQSGTMGTVNYSRQSGTYIQVGPFLVYQIELAGTVLSNQVTALSISTPPQSTQTNKSYGSSDIVTTLDLPIYASCTAQIMSLQNPEASTVALQGTLPFSFKCTGFYFTLPGTPFTPSFIIDQGTFAYSQQVGEYYKMGAATFFVYSLTASYSGVTTNTLGLTLPSTPAHPSVTKTILSDQNPLALLINQSSTFINPVTGSSSSLSGSGTITRQITGWYLDNTALSFSPILHPVGGTWVQTLPVMQAYYTSLNNIVTCTLTYSSQVTASTNQLQLQGLPLSMSNNVSCEIIASSNIDTPLSLVATDSSTYMTFWNPALNQPTQFQLSGLVTFTIALVYISQ